MRSVSLRIGSAVGPAALSAATRVTDGTASFKSDRRFASVSTSLKLNPVRLPPGRARVATSPLATGSTERPTIGIVVVACLAARTADVPPATITSTGSRTTSATRSGKRTSGGSVERNSRMMFLPSV